MARTRIEDLPKDMKISKEEMKNVVGGALITGTAEITTPKPIIYRPNPANEERSLVSGNARTAPTATGDPSHLYP